ncbi:uncharacterized protein N7483_008123 [Penicillium malachiteum]|uniref:uncharacterized protein n=1 Tax=Penicillium malachiteum TaxID=1324776 RepID=UPI0025472122|nr:uncharacterized protein N7483_008123 [Penicillium malachiteum]KAJ5726766.1 hypothetical protein N7483_008123 [Penicillium malachiteum]
MRPIQIIVCGKSSHVAIGVKEGIRPAYEVLHFINSVEVGVRDLPFLLQEQAPPSQGWANLGTQRYGEKVGAVVAGGGYNDADFARLREACEGKSRIPWLRHDISNEILLTQPKQNVGIEYGEQLSKQIVEVLGSLKKKNKMEEDGVYWFQTEPAPRGSSE